MVSGEELEKSTGHFPDREADAARGQHEQRNEHTEQHGVYLCGSWEEVAISNLVFQERGVHGVIADEAEGLYLGRP